MKKLLACLLALVLFIPCVQAAGSNTAETSILVVLAKVQNIDERWTLESGLQFHKIDGVIYMPLRSFGEKLGYTVSWDGQEKRVTLNSTDHELAFQIGSSTVSLDQTVNEMTVPCILIGNTTYVPLRSVSELLGFRVYWVGDEKNNIVWISELNLLPLDDFELIANDSVNFKPFLSPPGSMSDIYMYQLREGGTTSRDIKAGSTFDEVIEQYGEPYEITVSEDGQKVVKYISVYYPSTSMRGTLVFYFTDDVVQSVTVYPPA